MLLQEIGHFTIMIQLQLSWSDMTSAQVHITQVKNTCPRFKLNRKRNYMKMVEFQFR